MDVVVPEVVVSIITPKTTTAIEAASYLIGPQPLTLYHSDWFMVPLPFLALLVMLQGGGEEGEGGVQQEAPTKVKLGYIFLGKCNETITGSS